VLSTWKIRHFSRAVTTRRCLGMAGSGPRRGAPVVPLATGGHPRPCRSEHQKTALANSDALSSQAARQSVAPSRQLATKLTSLQRRSRGLKRSLGVVEPLKSAAALQLKSAAQRRCPDA
jgi:hypothetical protein